MNIVVTGSSGFIGRHLVNECERRWPTAFVQRVDTDDMYDCREFFANDTTQWDLAVHGAAITGGIEGTTSNAARLAAINAQLDGSFFEWLLDVKPHRAVYFSSSCAYPMLEPGAIKNLTESDIDLSRYAYVGNAPDNSYGWVKLTGEVIAQSVRDAGVSLSVVRPFAVYGDDQENCRMIPMFVERALSGAEVFEVWGPGNQASDFIHVDDTVNAILAMVEQNVDGPVNLGTGRGVDVDEAADIVMDAAGISREVVHNMDKPFGPRWRVADTTLLETFYTPKITLEEGVSRMVHG